ncbi:hypothetical protein [Shinella sedimenti]|uniref:Uncharacterized protein n=1 Tax=Shinella sedimenti TaxID=2919913 RepID=A0ABT0CGX8_9HYPH|nr:hypothetical protein [Shinella sedimenti]MCJ8147865.1 hypothetical protein [Shinella sedimenti]
MNPKTATPSMPPRTAEDNIAYIRQMLGELRSIANNDGADMLRYLIEMAYVEAGDIQSGVRPLSVRGHRDAPIDVAFQSPRKVKF